MYTSIKISRIFYLAPIFIFFLTSKLKSQSISIPEPEFVGQAALVYNDGKTVVKLEKTTAKTIVKSKISINSGMTQKLVLDGCCSSTIGEPVNGYLTIIIRVQDNKLDPVDVVQVLQFEKSKKERSIETFSFRAFGGSNQGGNIKRISFDGKKYGESSYLINVKIPEPGEYGIVVQDPSIALKSVATFGVK